MGKHLSDDYKRAAVQYYLKIGNQLQTCQAFECSERSLMRWLSRFSNNLKPSNTRTSYKITQQHILFAVQVLKENPLITIADVHNKLLAKFDDYNITKQHLNAVIRDNNQIKRAKVRHIPLTRFGKDIDINKQLLAFYDEIKTYKLEDIICIDETSLNLGMHRNYCRSKIGNRCYHITNDQQVFKRYTGIFAIGYSGCVHWKVYEQGGITADRLKDFIIEGNLKNKLIILDNASSHRSPIVKETILQDNKLMYSIPYQHFTNAIELWFSKLKSLLYKRKILSYQQLVEQITTILRNDIPKSMYTNIIKGAYQRDKEYKKNEGRYLRPIKKYKVGV